MIAKRIQVTFPSALLIILNKHTVIMSNYKTGKNLMSRSSDIFGDRSEKIQNPGHA
ncbi:hypothetical protein MmTuc01_1426 [Methanosarcina mazei Tuc01]|uniref:Uncharacterized protein n=1 Tax=Methanosarcina mazei Tuc01 TaxID=1236903 RepID=M1QIK4_METMZ|nr:hypothetical protein MmTuc01_1426 [Methanosarcina mazei Tuc01]